MVTALRTPNRSSRRDDVGEQEAELIFAATISICWGRLLPSFRWHWTMHLPTKSLNASREL